MNALTRLYTNMEDLHTLNHIEKNPKTFKDMSDGVEVYVSCADISVKTGSLEFTLSDKDKTVGGLYDRIKHKSKLVNNPLKVLTMLDDASVVVKRIVQKKTVMGREEFILTFSAEAPKPVDESEPLDDKYLRG